jgi:hypothetical protein
VLLACGVSEGSGGEDSGTVGDNNGTGGGGGTPVELSSIEDGEALFRFRGAFNETIRFAADFYPNSGWRAFKGPDGQGELETRASSLDYWAEEDDGQLSVSMNGIKTGEGDTDEDYKTIEAGTLKVMSTITPLAELRNLETFVTIHPEDLFEDDPISWDEASGEVEIQEIDMGAETARLVGKVSATLRDGDTEVKIKGVFKAKRGE